MTRPRLTVYSRRGCHLCEHLIEELLPLVRERATVEILDVDTRADWQAEYGGRVPVVLLDGRYLFQYRLDRDAIADALPS